jgi:hypothetical protein
VLHSNEDAATKILVPGFTVHESTPSGANGATVPPRFTQPNAGPPLPKGFCASGVCNSVVHSASRFSSSFLTGTAPAVGTARHDVAAATSRIRARRDIATSPICVAGDGVICDPPQDLRDRVRLAAKSSTVAV